MNEELQATNEELQAINDDARERGNQLGELNAFLESILGSLRGAVIMLDTDLYIHKWNSRAEELWGLRSDEVIRKNFLNLHSGLPVGQLREPIRACLSQKSPFRNLSVDAMNRRGKPIRLEVSCTPLMGPGVEDPRGVVLLMEQVQGAATGPVDSGEMR
jgi:two-component system CheB/CheR fusion protein